MKNSQDDHLFGGGGGGGGGGGTVDGRNPAPPGMYKTL